MRKIIITAFIFSNFFSFAQEVEREYKSEFQIFTKSKIEFEKFNSVEEEKIYHNFIESVINQNDMICINDSVNRLQKEVNYGGLNLNCIVECNFKEYKNEVNFSIEIFTKKIIFLSTSIFEESFYRIRNGDEYISEKIKLFDFNLLKDLTSNSSCSFNSSYSNASLNLESPFKGLTNASVFSSTGEKIKDFEFIERAKLSNLNLSNGIYFVIFQEKAGNQNVCGGKVLVKE